MEIRKESDGREEKRVEICQGYAEYSEKNKSRAIILFL